MKCLCNVKCGNLKDVDMFGKEPELYYNGRQKKTSWVGRIFSFSFVLSRSIEYWSLTFFNRGIFWIFPL